MYQYACRAVQCQQFEIALLLLEAGADPLYTCKTADEAESLAPLLAVMYAVPAGEKLVPMQPFNQHECLICCKSRFDLVQADGIMGEWIQSRKATINELSNCNALDLLSFCRRCCA